MSVSSHSSHSSSISEGSSDEESSRYSTAESEIEFSPFDDNIEPLASPEEIAEYEQAVTEEEHVANILQNRIDVTVDVGSW